MALAAARALEEERRAGLGGVSASELDGVDPCDADAVAALFDRMFGRDALEDAAIEFAESSNARRIELAAYELRGMPLRAEVLAPGVVLIGDSAAGAGMAVGGRAGGRAADPPEVSQSI